MSTPLIFCHYGSSHYLDPVFRCARLSNPHRRIVLLGDVTNKAMAQECGIEHRLLDDYNGGPQLEFFDKVYQLVQGKEHGHFKGGRDWVNFVFRRWFVIFNFITQEKIGSFWHLDSDNMILDDLSVHEAKFKDYDCTEQCSGMCMNGYISSAKVVAGYLDKINDIFQRRELLQSYRQEFDTIHPAYAFTEMRAYEIYRKEENIKSIRLNTVIDGSSFDDTIVNEDGMEMEDFLYGRKIKKIFLCADGRFFCVEKNTARLIRMNSLNLSYVPHYFFGNVLKHQALWGKANTVEPDITRMKTLARQPVPIKVIARAKAKKIAQGLGLVPKWA